MLDQGCGARLEDQADMRAVQRRRVEILPGAGCRAQPGRNPVHGLGAIEGAGERQEAARGVGEAGHRARGIRSRAFGDLEDRPRRPQTQDGLARFQAQSQRGASDGSA